MNEASWPVSRWLSFSIGEDFSDIALVPPMRSAKLLVQSSRWAVITELAQAASTTGARPLRAANDSKLGHSHHGGCRGHLRVHLNRRQLAFFGASQPGGWMGKVAR